MTGIIFADLISIWTDYNYGTIKGCFHLNMHVILYFYFDIELMLQFCVVVDFGNQEARFPNQATFLQRQQYTRLQYRIYEGISCKSQTLNHRPRCDVHLSCPDSDLEQTESSNLKVCWSFAIKLQ